MPHLTSQEKIFLICLCVVIATGSAISFFYKTRQDFVKTIELGDVRPFIRKVNINTASQEELMRVPYIGETAAQKIIQRRRERGGFPDLRELYTVKGFSPAFIGKITPYFKVR